MIVNLEHLSHFITRKVENASHKFERVAESKNNHDHEQHPRHGHFRGLRLSQCFPLLLVHFQLQNNFSEQDRTLHI